MTDKTSQDILLVKRIQDEYSGEAFEVLYDRYSKRVYNFCLNYLGNEEDARDTTQEIFIKVFKSISGFRFNSSFYTWLYRIMINTCNDMSRKKRSMDLEQDISTLANIASGEEAIPSLLTARQAMDAFMKGLGEMNGNARTILILRDLEGRSYEEISDIMKCRQGTVRSRLARARLSMAEKLKDFRDEM